MVRSLSSWMFAAFTVKCESAAAAAEAAKAANEAREAERAERRRQRREENEYDLLPVERATTSLADKFAGFKFDEE